MDNFIVSARKYRPQTFNSVVGQKSITTTLKNAIVNNHMAHAYLFCGPRGVGKTTCARIFAKTINCLNLSEDTEPCNECESCVSFNEERSYNIHELDAASNNSVDDIRNLIEQVRIPPQLGKYSVYIIDEVHMLSAAAFNAFLKTLEEPPSHALFVLATTEKHKILPTILSRCQVFNFSRITVEDATEHLGYVAKSENITAEHEALNIIAQKADGAMRDALSVFDQIVSFSGNEITYQKTIDNLNVLDYDYYFKLTEAFLAEDSGTALMIFDEILDKGFDGQHFISGLSRHIRDLMVAKDTQTLKLLEVGEKIKEKYSTQSQKTASDFLFYSLQAANEAEMNYRPSQNKRLTVELALIKICNFEEEKKKAILARKKRLAKEKQKKEAEPQQQKPSGRKAKTNAPPVYQNYPTVSPDISKPERYKKKETAEEAKQEEIRNEANPFNIDELKKVWLNYAEEIKERTPRIHNYLKSHEPELQDEHTVRIKLDNQSQEAAFRDKVYDGLLKSLRSSLRNYQIKLEIGVDLTQKAKLQSYNKSDILKHLIEKNSTLEVLKDKFDLDFD